jgi:hypothetical protein
VGAAIGLSLTRFNLLLFLSCVYIAISIHELGHLIAGKLVGMAPGGLMIGGLTFMKSGDRWTFRFQWEGLFGGLAKPLPVNGEFRPSRYAWMVAGGPLASLLSTLVFWLTYGGGEWTGCLLFWSGFFTVISLLPFSAGVNRTDGARLWLLIRHPERSRAWMAVVMVQAQDANGVRPRDWDADLVRQMLAGEPTDNEQPWRQLLASLRCSDQGDEAGSLEHLESALASSGRSGKVVRQALYLSAACECARLQRNADRARIWRERGLKLRKPETTSSTDAAIAMCEGRYEDALRDIAAARAYQTKRRLDSGIARFAKEILDKMERECLSAAPEQRNPEPADRPIAQARTAPSS